MTDQARRSQQQRGMALAVVIVACLALTLSAHALLLLARTGERIALADGSRVAEQYRAGAALAAVTRTLDSLPAGPGRQVSLPTPYGLVQARRLSPEVALLEAGAGPGGGVATLLYRPDAVLRVVGRAGGLRTPSVRREPSARVAAGPVCPAAATRWRPWIPPVPTGPGLPPQPGIGLLAPSLLLERLDPLLPGELALGPETGAAGGCRPGPGNWGDPDPSADGCTDRWGAGGTTASIRVRGAGQGLLVVDGDLTLAAGTVFRGWVVTTGVLSLEAGARLEGAADAAGGARLGPGAVFLADACGAGRALTAGLESLGVWRLGPPAWPVVSS